MLLWKEVKSKNEVAYKQTYSMFLLDKGGHSYFSLQKPYVNIFESTNTAHFQQQNVLSVANKYFR